MIKGFRFTNQLANAEVDARIHQEFLNKNDGIFYGMELSYTNDSVTIAEGLCEIAGRPIAIIDGETVAVSTENLYCLLILEIDLTKESTKDTFNQASFKLLTSSTSYPTVTQQDINKYNGTERVYQLEFARFRSGSTGITDFKDTRQFLNFDGIYAQIKSDCETVMAQIKQELENVKDGSAYVLKDRFNGTVLYEDSIGITGHDTINLSEDISNFKRAKIVYDVCVLSDDKYEFGNIKEIDLTGDLTNFGISEVVSTQSIYATISISGRTLNITRNRRLLNNATSSEEGNYIYIRKIIGYKEA